MDTHHHALLYIATSLEDSSVPESYTKPSADIVHIITDRLSIDDARHLNSEASVTSFTTDQRVFVIVAKQILPEAQNALLKLFEEPPAKVQFHLVVPQESIIIPTLRSRLSLAEQAGSTDSKNEVFEDFLRSSLGVRLTTVAELAKKKDVANMNRILDGAITYAQKQRADDDSLKPAVVFVDTYMRAPGASKKMLLEELALALPAGG